MSTHPDIVQKGDPILSDTAKEVSYKEIASPHIQEIIARMKTAMHSQADAVAIAAPQIGESVRIFVVSDKVFTREGAHPDETHDDMVCINPEITKLSSKTAWMEEGCLSVRWWYGEVKRATNVTIRAYDEHGRLFTRGAGGLLAQIFQHETDHLDGILFDEKARALREQEPGAEEPVPEDIEAPPHTLTS